MVRPLEEKSLLVLEDSVSWLGSGSTGSVQGRTGNREGGGAAAMPAGQKENRPGNPTPSSACVSVSEPV